MDYCTVPLVVATEHLPRQYTDFAYQIFLNMREHGNGKQQEDEQDRFFCRRCFVVASSKVHVSIAFFDKNKPVVGGEITATEQVFMSDQR